MVKGHRGQRERWLETDYMARENAWAIVGNPMRARESSNSSKTGCNSPVNCVWKLQLFTCVWKLRLSTCVYVDVYVYGWR